MKQSGGREQCRGSGRGIVTIAASALIALGLVLQWTELIFTRFFGHNSWLFATLFGEMWNIISTSQSATQWHRNLYYWPLLLIITGAAILFSRNRKKLSN